MQDLSLSSKNTNQKGALDERNYAAGFLIDDELLAGITVESAGQSSQNNYTAFVLNHLTGEYLGYETFLQLSDALHAINQIPRAWVFEATKGCGTAICEEGKCKGDGCKRFSKCHPQEQSRPEAKS